VLGVVVGGWLLVQPQLGLASLTCLVIAFFVNSEPLPNSKVTTGKVI
jgi:hypothetical protein